MPREKARMLRDTVGANLVIKFISCKMSVADCGLGNLLLEVLFCRY
jgi:hypothetical protein